MRIMSLEEMLKALKTDKARRAYAADRENWYAVGSSMTVPFWMTDGSAKNVAHIEAMQGFRIYRVVGWVGESESGDYGHYETLYAFEYLPNGCIGERDLRSPAKVSATMKRQMGEWKKERK